MFIKQSTQFITDHVKYDQIISYFSTICAGGNFGGGGQGASSFISH